MSQTTRSQVQLGAVLRRQRKARALTQAALGAQVRRRQATVSGLEAGEGATLETLFAVLAALDLELVVRERAKGSASQIEDLF